MFQPSEFLCPLCRQMANCLLPLRYWPNPQNPLEKSDSSETKGESDMKVANLKASEYIKELLEDRSTV